MESRILQLLTVLSITATVISDTEIVAELGYPLEISSNFSIVEDEQVASSQWHLEGAAIVRTAFTTVTTIDERASLTNDYSLVLRDVTLADSGEYTLNIITTKRSVDRKYVVQVLAAPTFEANAIPVIISEDETPQEIAECRATAGSKPYSIGWYDENGILVANASDLQGSANADNPELVDLGLTLGKVVDAFDDGKEYQCRLNNALGRTQELRVSLSISEPTTTIATTTVQAYPKIYGFTSASRVTLLLGESRNLVCMATGVPEPTVVWTKDGQQIGEGVGDKEISVTASQYSMAGEYKCSAQNREGEDTKSLSVVVEGKPAMTGADSLDNRTETVTMRPDDKKLTLACQATSVPVSTIRWTTDDKDVREVQGAVVNVPGRESITSYLNITSEHFLGEKPISRVRCVASNKHGNDEKYFYVSVAAVRSSNIAIIVGIVLAVLIPVTVCLIFFFVVKKRRETGADEEAGKGLGFATCCEGSKVKSKELKEEDDGANGAHVKEVSEDGSVEEKKKLTENEEKATENEAPKGEEENQEIDEAGQDGEKNTEKPKKSKFKMPHPTRCCGRKKTITKECDMNDEEDCESVDKKTEDEEKDSGKGDTLGKVNEEAAK